MPQNLKDLIHQAEQLPVDEQVRLAAHLMKRARHRKSVAAKEADKKPLKWADLLGTAPCPLAGEDAQAWVSRTRRESDEHREKQWGPL